MIPFTPFQSLLTNPFNSQTVNRLESNMADTIREQTASVLEELFPVQLESGLQPLSKAVSISLEDMRNAWAGAMDTIQRRLQDTEGNISQVLERQEEEYCTDMDRIEAKLENIRLEVIHVPKRMSKEISPLPSAEDHNEDLGVAVYELQDSLLRW